MVESDTADFQEDPLHPENVGAIQFIMLARIYDLLMVDLMDRKPEVAKKIVEAHANGTILGTAPILNGTFLESERLASEANQ